jgi:phage replication O-like protein O
MSDEKYTMIPNDVLEMLARAKLSPYQSQVLLVIIRMTFGWHKESDTIANLQFQNATGIPNRSNVRRTVRELQARQIIVVSRDNHSNPIYCINRNLAQWSLLSPETTTKKRARNGGKPRKVVSRDNHGESVETTPPESPETTNGLSPQTPSEEIRKERIKESQRKSARSAASFSSSSSSRIKDSDSEQARKTTAQAEYQAWRAASTMNNLTFQKWFAQYG